MTAVSAAVKAEVQGQLTETSSQLRHSVHTLETDLGRQLLDLAARLQLLATEQSRLAYNASAFRQGLSQLRDDSERLTSDLRNDLDTKVRRLGSRLDDVVEQVNRVDLRL